MTKSDLVSAVSEETEIAPTDVRRIIEGALGQIADALANGERIEFRNFGVFSVQKRKARMAYNPKEKTVMKLPARRVVTFRAGKAMKESVR